MKDREKIRQAIIEKFRAAAVERIAKLNLALVEIEKRPEDTTLADEVMREIHTLKGEARMVDFLDVNLIAHRTEDLLRLARSRGFDLSGGLGDLILSGLDAISILIDKRAGTEQGGVDLEAFVSEVERFLAESKGGRPPSSALGVEEEQPPRCGPRVVIDKDRAEAIRTRLPEERFLRINLDRLDALSDLVGDMLLTRVRLLRTFERLRSAFSAGEVGQLVIGREQVVAIGQFLVSIKEQAFTYERELESLGLQVRDLRLVSLNTLFRAYPRLVRDLAKEQRKQIDVKSNGGEIELDKRVLDQLGDSILHILRNAVDHGIEKPEERKGKGKSGTGTIVIAARQMGGRIEIEISDDGGGIDPELVLARAVERGIVSAETGGALSNAERTELLFTPGFSTRKEVSEISGRGIGLDVVKRKIEAIGGSVRIESAEGKGTSFVLTAPITVAIWKALLVEEGGVKYAIPSLSIERIEQVELATVANVGSGRGARIGGLAMPFADLGGLLGLAAAPLHGEGKAPVVVVHQDQDLLALKVEKVLAEREIVLKPLDPFLAGLRLFSGTATLADGELALVLNPAEIVRTAAAFKKFGAAPGLRPASEAQDPGTILVVEDSEITRDLVVEIVRSMGYRVMEATNGQEALNKLREIGADLILTDLNMPVMDGFELLAKTKGDPMTRDIPVVVLTTRGSEEDRRRALALGADSYLVKSEFHEHLLMDTVRRYRRR